jgi:Na+/H+ antiporter NhaD/arsenite permease-like protein
VLSVGNRELITEALQHHLSEIAGILFFLLGAMTIVELIDAHDGFELVTARITAVNRRKLLVTIAFFSFFLSAILDNLTTSIVMMSLVRKLIHDETDRMYYGGVVIIAANAGGAWSPIGDVTTTMLWLGGQITAVSVMKHVFLPSLVCLVVPILWIGMRMKGDIQRPEWSTGGGLRQWLREVQARIGETPAPHAITLPTAAGAVGKNLAELNLRARTGVMVLSITRDGGTIATPSPREPLRGGDVLELSGDSEAVSRAVNYLATNETERPTTAVERATVFFAGLGALLFVPVFKTLTHLPPFMGVLLGLGVLWTITELIHKRKNDEVKGSLTVAAALQRVDAPSVLFFLGILLAISALQSGGLLTGLASLLDKTIGNIDLITVMIGLASSVVDNVPLVAAVQRMYSLSADRSSLLVVSRLLRGHRRQHLDHRVGGGDRGDGDPAHHVWLVRAPFVLSRVARLRRRSARLSRRRGIRLTLAARLLHASPKKRSTISPIPIKSRVSPASMR